MNALSGNLIVTSIWNGREVRGYLDIEFLDNNMFMFVTAYKVI